jgi:SagB-type dehydrogenase family enzyme
MTGYEDVFPDPHDPVYELWSLRPDVLVESDQPDGVLTLLSQWGEIAVRSAGPRLRGLLSRMQLGPTRLENVLDSGRMSERQAVLERATVMLALDRLQHLVVRSLATDEGSQVLLSVEPISRRARFRPAPVDPARPVRLSRFTVLRGQHGALQAESPLALHRVLLHKPEAAMIASALAQQRSLAELNALVAIPPRLVAAVVSFLCAAGIVVQGTPSEDGFEFAEDGDPVLRMWSSVDLMFHTRSSLGRHDGDFGATYPLGSECASEPPVKPLPQGGRIPLYRPKIEEIVDADAPFTAVLEARHSARRFSPLPPSARELGELLYRALRIRSRICAEGGDPADGALIDRPYPSGGAIHELEYYITVDRCEGLRPGVYAYDALRHELVPISGPEQVSRVLQGQAELAAELDQPPPVLITVTARFGQIFRKYSAMGYALVLKDAGVVLMTLQLVATALRLAACPVGGTEIDESSRLLGLDWRAESGVAALVLGRAVPAEHDAEPDPGEIRYPANDPQWREIGTRYVHGGR